MRTLKELIQMDLTALTHAVHTGYDMEFCPSVLESAIELAELATAFGWLVNVRSKSCAELMGGSLIKGKLPEALRSDRLSLQIALAKWIQSGFSHEAPEMSRLVELEYAAGDSDLLVIPPEAIRAALLPELEAEERRLNAALELMELVKRPKSLRLRYPDATEAPKEQMESLLKIIRRHLDAQRRAAGLPTAPID